MKSKRFNNIKDKIYNLYESKAISQKEKRDFLATLNLSKFSSDKNKEIKVVENLLRRIQYNETKVESSYKSEALDASMSKELKRDISKLADLLQEYAYAGHSSPEEWLMKRVDYTNKKLKVTKISDFSVNKIITGKNILGTKKYAYKLIIHVDSVFNEFAPTYSLSYNNMTTTLSYTIDGGRIRYYNMRLYNDEDFQKNTPGASKTTSKRRRIKKELITVISNLLALDFVE